ncbi:hypothetical protein [Nocardiopsis sp. CNT312]|uniref:hypothetical protein n=1 Tax=Nocardiopsis sp. CNT312 TaxID=1137268 RepID=UPI0004AD05FC|nr:hypothetical protein [Nocardiopsis sp. CNT312]
MIDITTDDLLAAVRDALDVSPPGGADGHLPYLELVRDRGAVACRALGYAAASGDLVGALDMVDGALSRLPVAYATSPRPSGKPQPATEQTARSIQRVV